MSWILFLRKVLKKWKFLQEIRRQRRELLKLDERLLNDIGISRIDAEREAKRPFWDVVGVKDASLRDRNPPETFKDGSKGKFGSCASASGGGGGSKSEWQCCGQGK